MAIPASDMMLELIPSRYIGMNDKSTATGMVTIGMMADGMCQRKIRITRLTMIISTISSCFSVSIEALDQLGTVIGRDDLDALRQRRLQLLQLLFDPLDDLVGILAVAHDDDAADGVALPIQIRNAAADLRAPSQPGPRRATAPECPLSVFRTTCSRSPSDFT